MLLSEMFFACFACRAFKRVEFHAARLIDGKQRTTLRLNAAVKHFEDAFLRFELGGEELIEFGGAAHLDDFEIIYHATMEKSSRMPMMILASGVAR